MSTFSCRDMASTSPKLRTMISVSLALTMASDHWSRLRSWTHSK